MENINAKKFILGIVILSILIVAGSYLSTRLQTKKINPPSVDKTTTPPSQTAASSESIPKPPVFSGKQVVTLTKDGFDPAEITIKKGTLIQWLNKSGAEASVNSQNHPTHQLYPSLNLGRFPDGSSVSLIFDKAGTYKYHDHLHPDKTGTVIVE